MRFVLEIISDALSSLVMQMDPFIGCGQPQITLENDRNVILAFTYLCNP